MNRKQARSVHIRDNTIGHKSHVFFPVIPIPKGHIRSGVGYRNRYLLLFTSLVVALLSMRKEGDEVQKIRISDWGVESGKE